MNHAVVSIVNEEPAKVRCRTCHSDHDFRHEQPPPPKVDARKAALFNQVLANVTGLPAQAPEAAPVAETEQTPAVDALPEPAAEAPIDAEAGIEAEAETEAKPKTRKKKARA
jgi:hypothetical protein